MDDVIYPFADKGLKSTRHYLNKGLLKITFLVNFVSMHIFIKSRVATSPKKNGSGWVPKKWSRVKYNKKLESGKFQ